MGLFLDPARNSPMIRTIAVIRAGALGDVVLTLPALRALSACHPRSMIRVAGYPQVWQAAESLVHDTTSIDSPVFAGLFTDSPSPALAAWLESVDLAVAWTVHDPRAAMEASGASTVIHASPYPPPGMHAADWLLRSVSPSPQAPAIPQLDLTDGELAQGHALLDRMGLERPVIIHPGAGARWKRWPARRFARVAAALLNRGHGVAVVEGPADVEVTAEVQEHVSVPLPVIRNLPVRLVAATLAHSLVFLGNDSGVTHLAAAAGAPLLALFGPTDPASWAPRGNVRVLRACRCAATRQGQIRVCDDPACIEGITVESVLAELRTLPFPLSSDR